MAASALDALADSALGASNHIDAVDDRSSSLSELEDGMDEEDEDVDVDVPEEEDEEQLSDVESRVSDPVDDAEVGSETETERLDITPRRFSIANMDPLAGLTKPDRTPSKLAQQVTHEEPASPERRNSLDSSSSSSRKRKRGASDASSNSEPEDDLRPLPKRASLRSPPRIIPMREPSPETEDEPERPEEEPLDDEEGAEIEEAGAPVAPADEEEGEDVPAAATLPAASAPARRGRKPKRKGRLPALTHEETTAASELSEADVHEPEDAQEEALDEDELASPDEEVTKRKAAIEAFAQIEKLWTRFREVQVADQLQRLESEIELLERAEPTHPEYMAQIHCINTRRDEKIRYEDRLLGYDIQAAKVRTVAERTQLHSQYFQACRELKDDAFETCNREYYALQNERRRYGAIDSSRSLLFNPDRPVQIKQQSAYNLEVSILSGMAKYEGFPSAPEMRPVSDADANSDLLAMGITTAVAAPVPTPSSARPTVTPHINPQPFPASTNIISKPINIPSRAPTPTDSQFFEQNPWANPPAHHHNHGHNHAREVVAYTYHNFQTGAPVSASSWVTPIAGRKMPVVEHGSASTLELASNPPSSAAKAVAGPPGQTSPPTAPAPREKPSKGKGGGGGSSKARSNAQSQVQAQIAEQQPDGRIITTHNSSAVTTGMDQSSIGGGGPVGGPGSSVAATTAAYSAPPYRSTGPAAPAAAPKIVAI